MRKKKRNPTASIDVLLGIMSRLYGPGGCPWDREQTHSSLRRYLVEETFEFIDAVDRKDAEQMKDELGDILLQVVFHAEIERRKGTFDFDDVADAIVRKLVRRHPHVFGTGKVRGPADVLRNWEEIKKGEKAGRERRFLMDKVPRSLPPLARCRKILDTAYKAGFTWKKPGDVPKKLREEVGEFLANLRRRAPQAELEKEFGDILFVLVNLARDRGVDPELALNRTNDKFIRRFNHVEAELGRANRKFRDARFEELLSLYRKAKARTE